MFKDGLCVNVVIDGDIVDDKNGVVAIPFDSEYSLRLKNKTGMDAVAKILVDGELVTEKGDVIIHSNSTVSIERFIESLKSGNKFRFVSLDDVDEKDKDRPSNGIVEVKFRLTRKETERIIYDPKVIEHHHHHYYYGSPRPKWDYDTSVPYYPITCSNSTAGMWSGNTSSSTTLGNISNVTYTSSNNCSFASASVSDVEDGKTVRGDYSDQKFEYSYIGELEKEEVSIKLRLVGYKTDQ